MSPRIAWSAVLLPAPLGPMSPRMRPSSTRRSTPSKATVLPKTLRRPRASITDMSALLLRGVRRLRRRVCGRLQQFFRFQTKSLNGRVDPRPLLLEELLAFGLQQQLARSGIDEHAPTSFRLDELLVDELLIALQHRERIDPVLGRDRAHGRQRIALVEHAVENHGDDAVAKLAVNRLAVVPFGFHAVFQVVPCGSQERGSGRPNASRARRPPQPLW